MFEFQLAFIGCISITKELKRLIVPQQLVQLVNVIT